MRAKGGKGGKELIISNQSEVLIIYFKYLTNTYGAEGLSSAVGKRWKNEGKRWKNSTFPKYFPHFDKRLQYQK